MHLPRQKGQNTKRVKHKTFSPLPAVRHIALHRSIVASIEVSFNFDRREFLILKNRLRLVCAYVRVRARAYTSVHYTCVCVCQCVYARTYIHLHVVCVYVCACVRVCGCVCVCGVSVCVCARARVRARTNVVGARACVLIWSKLRSSCFFP